jgi:hypothetical protein
MRFWTVGVSWRAGTVNSARNSSRVDKAKVLNYDVQSTLFVGFVAWRAKQSDEQMMRRRYDDKNPVYRPRTKRCGLQIPINFPLGHLVR